MLSVPGLCWAGSLFSISVLNKLMSNLNSLTCARMASVKTNSWHFPKSKMAAGLVYCYRSLCQFESFSWSIHEGSKLFLCGPCSLYISHWGHNEVNSKRVFMKDRLLYCKPQNTCYFLPARYPKYAYTRYHPKTWVAGKTTPLDKTLFTLREL